MSIPRNRFPLVLWKHIFVLGSIFGLISSGCGSASSTKLAAPTDLKVQASGPKLLTITWNDNNNNEDGFKIERKVEGETFEVVATVLANVTSYRDNELAAQTYYYRVKAYNSSGDSDYSEEISYTIAEATISVPANLLAQSTQPGEISLSWTDNSDNEDGFTLQRKSANDAYSNIAQLTADVSSYTDTNLVNGETYYYQIKAFNQTQESEYSNEASATVIDEPAETVPAAPSRLSAKADSDSRITLTWRDNADNELGFKIERKTGAAAFTEIATVAANIRTYVNKTGLSASTNYTYRVMAYNSKGNSPYSNEVSAATESPPMQIPAAPSNLSASAISASQIKLSWSDNADNESLFKIERSIDGESFEQIATTNANVLTYSDSSLNASTKYTYRVRANNQAGDSDYSNLADATTNGSAVSIPEAPSSLQANSNSSSQITLSWTDNSNNEEKFLIERHIEGEDFAQIGMTTANASTYVDTSLSSSTIYYYRIRANNTAGNSEYSAEASAQTLATVVVPPGEGWLKTVKNKIVYEDGTVFHGRGANIHDTRNCGACSSPNVAGVNRRVDELVDVWGANFLRLCLESHDAADNPVNDPEYMQDIVEIVEHIGDKTGVYVLVSLWWDKTVDKNPLAIPHADVVPIWEKLAEELAPYPHVIFGLVNEPKGTHSSDSVEVDDDDVEVWEAMNNTTAAIRAVEARVGSPKHLVAVQGTRAYGKFLQYYPNHPITAGGGENIVYEVHVYYGNDEDKWEYRWKTPAQTLPVIIGEFAEVKEFWDNLSLEDCDKMMIEAEALDIPWLAWTFHTNCGNPLITANNNCETNVNISPTSGWGELIYNRLQTTWGSPDSALP